jgi:hypothetical protein
MKKSTLIMAVALLAAFILAVACEGGPNSNLSTPTPALSPTPTPTRTPTPTPVPVSKGPHELSRAKALNYIDYAWAGSGTSTKMKLTVTNKTAEPIIAHGELGTKLEPGTGNVQSMVVTREFELEIEPNEKKEVDVDVACLDISLPPPGAGDTSWKVSLSPGLKKFIACVNDIDDVKSLPQANRGTFVQYSLWKARGASLEDWIDFLDQYGSSADGRKLERDAAQREAEEIDRISAVLVRECPLETP